VQSPSPLLCFIWFPCTQRPSPNRFPVATRSFSPTGQYNYLRAMLFVGHRICIIGAVRSFVASLATGARCARCNKKTREKTEKRLMPPIICKWASASTPWSPLFSLAGGKVRNLAFSPASDKGHAKLECARPWRPAERDSRESCEGEFFWTRVMNLDHYSCGHVWFISRGWGRSIWFLPR
jgi:hypothetical protein